MDMTKAKTLAAFWNDFAESVIPENASVLQVKTMRESFYAGAFASMQLMSNATKMAPKAEAIKAVNALRAEMRDFAETMVDES